MAMAEQEYESAECLAGHGEQSKAMPVSTLHDLRRWDMLVPATAELHAKATWFHDNKSHTCRLECTEFFFFFGGTSFSFSLKLPVKTIPAVCQTK